MQAVARKFWELEVPTWILSVAIYGSWFLLIWYRENRAKLPKHNGNFLFTGYWPIARDCMSKPVFTPVHPTA